MRPVVLDVLAAGVLVGLAIQAVPYGHRHTNPAVRQEPAWDSARTRVLAVRACFDCHSNQTAWPWYANVAPASWLIQHDVDEGREVLNFSEFDRAQPKAVDSAGETQKAEMPPWYYTLHGRAARLSASERHDLIAGLRATFGAPGRRAQR
jgi:mono/diheme cytochrome c family protein